MNEIKKKNSARQKMFQIDDDSIFVDRGGGGVRGNCYIETASRNRNRLFDSFGSDAWHTNSQTRESVLTENH